MSVGGEELAEANADGEVDVKADPENSEVAADIDTMENEDATTTKPELPEEDEPTSDRDMTANDQAEGEDEVDTPEEAEAEAAEGEAESEEKVEEEKKN